MAVARETKRVPAWERVYANVRERVISGAAAPGQFLEEEQVSAEVGVSRTPVREAFHRLERDGFIELLPRRGAMVRAVTASELVQLFATRRIIESHVVRHIAAERLMVPASLDRLIAGLAVPAAFADVRRQAEGDFLFHRTLVSLLGNDVLLQVFDGLQRRAQRVSIAAISAHRERLALIHAEHAALLEAMRSGAPDAAGEILLTHLRPAFEVLSKLPGFDGRL